jgi:hypothetical protein
MIKPEIEEKEKIESPLVGEITSQEKDITEIMPEDIENMVPQMNVSMPESPKDVQHLITDDQYLEILSDIVSTIKEDRKQVSDYIDNFADMVMNDGDATTSSKEALVNLVKIKTDLQDKMLKAADLMTRLKIKNTYAYSGPHLNALQQNNFNIGDTNFDRKELIKAINQAKKKKKE